MEAWLQAHRAELLEDLQCCIRIPSVAQEDDSGYPFGLPIHRCLTFMLELARQKGLAVHNMDNYLGWCEYGQGEELVAVLAHLDVVPPGTGWTEDPFGGRIRDGRIYGRGAMDDKGPAMAALYALLALKESRIPLQRRVRLIFGLNEESGSRDMRYYRDHGGELPQLGFTPDGEYPVINGEKGLVNETYRCSWSQTGPLRLTLLEGGQAHNIVPAEARAVVCCPPEQVRRILEMQGEKIRCSPLPAGVEVRAEGVSAHGGTPEEGENAIGRLMGFLAGLPLDPAAAGPVGLLAEKFGLEYDGRSLGIARADAPSGALTMNLGVLRGDEQGMEIQLNYRYPVTSSFEACGPVVQETLESVGFRRVSGVHKPAIYLPEDHPLVTALLEVYRQQTGQPGRAKCIGGGTYAKMLPNILAFGPLFPGDEVREHKPDEFMEVERLLDNARMFAAAMLRLAGTRQAAE